MGEVRVCEEWSVGCVMREMRVCDEWPVTREMKVGRSLNLFSQ